MDRLLYLKLMLVIFAFAALFVGVLKKKKKMIVLFGVICICIVGVLIYNIAFYNNSETVTIKTAEENDFTIKIENHLLKYEYHYAQFSSKFSEDEVVDILSSQYENVFYDSELKQIAFSYQNQIYTIENYEHSYFLWNVRNKYMFRNNTIDLSIDSENHQIPIPLNAIDDSVEVYSKQMKLKCNFDILKAYYENFDNVKIDENQILLMYDGYHILLTVSQEEIITIEVTNEEI